MVLEKTLESTLDWKKIQSVHPKGGQSWIFTGRTDAEAETPRLWPPDVKNWLIWKDHDAGKDWRQEEKGMAEDEMVGWHHQLDGMSVSKLWAFIMNKEAWWAVVSGVVKCWARLSDWTELNLIISDINHLFIWLLAIYLSCMMNLFKFSAQFLIDPFAFFFFLILSCMSYLYILEINPLLVTLFANNFSHFIGCLSFCLWFPLLCKSFKFN